MTEKFKVFNIRMPMESWLFLKNTSARQESSMSEIINDLIDKYKRKLEKDTKTV